MPAPKANQLENRSVLHPLTRADICALDYFQRIHRIKGDTNDVFSVFLLTAMLFQDEFMDKAIHLSNYATTEGLRLDCEVLRNMVFTKFRRNAKRGNCK